MKQFVFFFLFWIAAYGNLYSQQNILPNGNGFGSNDIEAVTYHLFTGQGGGYFGSSLKNAGDVNGDGYQDVIAGAYLQDIGAFADAGRAYIYFGGSAFNSIIDVILSGEAAGDYFGYSVSGAGDVNGDGFDDVIVGAYNNDHTASDAGTAYIYFGGTYMDNTADVTIYGAAGSDRFGYSVSNAGDVNSDGFDDVIIGAYGNDTPGSNYGRAYIYLGESIMDNTADITFNGNEIDGGFGTTVSTADDFNGDGFDDVIIGEKFGGALNEGKAYIYLGGSPMNNISDLTLAENTGTSGFFSSAISNAGDVNADGFSDIIIGAFYSDAGGNEKGQAFLYFGGASLNSTADFVFTGISNEDYLGCAVSSAGDINADGFSDLIVGAYGTDYDGSLSGRVYVFWGGTTVDAIPDLVLSGNSLNRFGCAVSSVDLNNDNSSELLVGAYSPGYTYIFYNSYSGYDLPDEYYSGTSSSNNLGSDVCNAGDVNGDGYADILISSVSNAYLYFGGPSADNVADLTFDGTVDDNYGNSISSAGDVNGDGFMDIIIGAKASDVMFSNGGAAYIYFGGTNMDIIADVSLFGAAENDNFGYSVSGAGDVNRDGYADVIISAPFNDVGGNAAGRVYVYYGGASMNTTADVTISGTAVDQALGVSVSNAGDVNGDGYSDVIIGQQDADGSGEAGIYFGSSSMNYTVDVTLTCTLPADYFGCSVSDLGDVNGDGYDDVIVGASNYDGTGTNIGRAYIFYGGISMNNVADVTLTGFTDVDYFGNDVSFAGDINGDNFNDIFVAAYKNDAGGSDAGRAYVFFGGTTIDDSPDLIFTGESSGEWFGCSISDVGDINNDGFDDVIVGAEYNDFGFANAGRAYLFLSSNPPVKPRIIQVEDVDEDQGGKVTIKFTRSAYDIIGVSTITKYIIERSLPAGANGFYWEIVEEITPSKNAGYLYTANTFSDASATFFRITALTSNEDVFWRSNIMSGTSQDNIAPGGVSGFSGSTISGDIKLTWNYNDDPDINYYSVYRSSQTTIDPDVITPLVNISDTTYLDPDPLPGFSYYFIRARDIHNNYGPLSSCSSNPLPVELISFTASAEGNNITLKWETVTEVNVSVFEIERSKMINGKGTEFIKIGEIGGHGNSNSPMKYSFQDKNLDCSKYSYRLKILDNNGSFKYSPVVETEIALPLQFKLSQNYPNPFNPSTKIKYSIPAVAAHEQVSVLLKVYDVLGNEVAVLVNEAQAPGEYNINFNAELLSSGIYYYRLTIHSDKLSAGIFSETKKMIMLK